MAQGSGPARFMIPRQSGKINQHCPRSPAPSIANSGIHTVAYNTSKAGRLSNLTRALAGEWGPYQ